jgi:hypothetical protein
MVPFYIGWFQRREWFDSYGNLDILVHFDDMSKFMLKLDEFNGIKNMLCV